MSSYPSVQKDFTYPVGHLHVLVSQECEGVHFNQLVGLVKCDITAKAFVLPCSSIENK